MGAYPPNGCWEVDIEYYGGGEDPTTHSMGLNVLFLSNVPRSPTNFSLQANLTVQSEVRPWLCSVWLWLCEPLCVAV